MGLRRRSLRAAVSLVFLAALTIGVVSLVLLLNARMMMTMTMTNRLELAEQADLQAENVLEMAKGRLLADREFGKNGESVLIGTKEENGIWAEVSFSADSEFASQNNLGEPSSKFGKGGVVLDPGMVQLIAVSNVRNQKVVAYEVVEGPPLAFSLGSSGALTASGQTLIGGLESSAALADGLDDSDLVEGGVVANGTADHLPSGVPATLTLKDEVRVVGDAKTSGTFQKDDTVTIERGEVKQSPDKEDLPQISIAEYDPADKAVQHTDATVADGSPLYGFHRYANPGNPAYAVTFTEEVDLQGALIYVDGDVILDKPLKGTGALVATGKVTLRGGANMKADALAAVLAGGDLTISGVQNVPSLFTGLLYTEGNLALSNTRTVGAAIAAGTGEGGSMMSIVDSEVFSSPEGSDVSIVIQDFVDGGPVGMGAIRGEQQGDSDLIIEPVAADLFVNGAFITDPVEIAKLLKIRYNGVTYDGPEELPASISSEVRNTLRSAFGAALDIWVRRAQRLQEQHEREPVEIVRFDLNEFLNVNDRLRSSRMFYMED